MGAITWLLVSAIVILPMGIAYLRASGVHSSSYAIGSAFGAAFLIFLAAAAAQAVHRRVTGRVEPAPLQGFVAIAGVLAIGVQIAIRSAEGDRSLDRALVLIRECRESDPAAFGTPPAGMRFAPLSPTELAGFRQGAAASLPPEISPDMIATASLVDASGRPRAIVVGVPGIGQAAEGDTYGFEASLVSGVGVGVVPSEQMVGGIRVVTGTAGPTAVAAAENGCWVDAVITSSGENVVSLAAPIFSG